MALELFRWWYGRGWATLLSRTNNNFVILSETFSAGTLLRTLFAPWKRIITYPGASLDAHLRAFADNLVSRVVGFVVRMFVLFTFVLLGGLALIISILQLVIWPLVPPAILAAIVMGVL